MVGHFLPPFLAFLASACFSATIFGFFSTSSNISFICRMTYPSTPYTPSFRIS